MLGDNRTSAYFTIADSSRSEDFKRLESFYALQFYSKLISASFHASQSTPCVSYSIRIVTIILSSQIYTTASIYLK